MTKTSPKMTLWFFLGAGILFLLSGFLIATTTRSLDLFIHDRYVAIHPIHLFIVSVIFLVAYAAWKMRFSH